MKITIQHIQDGEDELIIRCREINAEVESILHLVEGQGSKLTGMKEDGKIVLLLPGEIYYFESVDGVVYAYLQNGVYRMRESLFEIENRLEIQGFFRCSRTMVANIYKIAYLKSEPGSRMLATLDNGEKVVISRKYAGVLRNLLKKGGSKKK